MAEVVLGVSVPHNPFLPLSVPKDADSVDARSFRRVGELLSEAEADLVVAFGPDHISTFYFENLPTFAIPAVDSFDGPNDGYAGLTPRSTPSDAELGRHLYLGALRRDFDPARVDHLDVDHGVLVALELLSVPATTPVVPIVLNLLAPPIVSAHRAFDFGKAIGSALGDYAAPLRVALVAHGGIIQEVAGPRSEDRPGGGAPDKPWLAHVVTRLEAGELDLLVDEATPERIANTSNAAGELLAVIAMLGALGPASLLLLEPEPTWGHMFGAWKPAED